MGLSQTGKFSPRTTGRAMKWESKRVSGAKKKKKQSLSKRMFYAVLPIFSGIPKQPV